MNKIFNQINNKELERLEIQKTNRKLELEIMKNLDFEIFLPIEGFNNYFVSNFGNIKNYKTDKIMKQRNDKDGYKLISLYKNDKQKCLRVHRLVVIAFIDNPYNKAFVDHIDNNPANNMVKNLRWCSQNENEYNKGKLKNNTSGFRGVHFDKKSNKYISRIMINGKRTRLGVFETADEASKKFKEVAKVFHGEFYSVKN